MEGSVYLCTSWWKTVYELELRWRLLVCSCTYLDVIDCNSEELSHIWVCLSMEGLIWILQQWDFKCWVGFETTKLGVEEILSKSPIIYQKEENSFSWFGPSWCLLLIIKGDSSFPFVVLSTDLYLHPCREQEPMRKCWLKFWPPEHLRKCGILNRFICKVKFCKK